MAAVLNDDDVPDALHRQILSRFEEFTVDNEATALRATAARATTAGFALPAAALTRVAAATGDAGFIADALNRRVGTLPAAEERSVLAQVGSDYAGLATPGTEFSVEPDDAVSRVLERLKDANLITVKFKKDEFRLQVTP